MAWGFLRDRWPRRSTHHARNRPSVVGEAVLREGCYAKWRLDPTAFEAADLAGVYGMVSIGSATSRIQATPADRFSLSSHPGLPLRRNECQKRWRGCIRRPGGHWKRPHLCLLWVRSGSGKLAMLVRKSEETHVEDVKDSVEVRLPTGYHFPAILRMD